MNINTEKVKQFQQLFDTIGNKPNFDNWQLRVKLIQEELDELKEAFESNDMVEVADAYGDIMFLVLGGVYKHGVPCFEQIFNEICDSNLSKADVTLDDAMLSKQKYSNDNIETHIEHKNNRFIIRRNEDNKVLKSHKYTPVSLEKYFTLDDLDQELNQISSELEEYIESEYKNNKDETFKSNCDRYLTQLKQSNYLDTTSLTMLISMLNKYDNNTYIIAIKEKLRQNINGRLSIKFG